MLHTHASCQQSALFSPNGELQKTLHEELPVCINIYCGFLLQQVYTTHVTFFITHKTVNVTTPADNGIQNFQILSLKDDASFCQLVCFQDGNRTLTTLCL